MNQMTIFDFSPATDMNETFSVKVEPEKPLRTLKRKIKHKPFDPTRVEKLLMSKIGTLLLHKLDRIKEFERTTKYKDSLHNKIYNKFFKMLVESVTKDEYERQFKAIGDLLSDDTTTVTLERVLGFHENMTDGVSFYVKVKDKNREVVFITGTKQKKKARHRTRRYYPTKGNSSFRMITSVNKLLSELLIEKEARYYYRRLENRTEYLELMKSIMIQERKIYFDSKFKIDYPKESEKMIEDANRLELMLTEHTMKRDTYMYQANLYVYGSSEIFDLNAMYNLPEGEDINGCHLNYLSTKFLNNYLEHIIPKIKEVKSHMKQLKKSTSDYATTYQQKKNIPQKTLDRMKSSKLLKYFSDVEYDELVDLANIGQFETEIISYIEKFNIQVPEQASFKVRRLGNRKAAGVFFPAFCTLAVDVNHPKAFLHEFWHMIDYFMLDNSEEFTGDRLSSRSDFDDVLLKYKDVVTEHIMQYPEDNPIRVRHFGNTKYNMDYFFENTEVFARSAEMYFASTFNGDSSLVEDQFSVYYPDDKELRELIEKYFMNLLKEDYHEKIKSA